MKETQAKDEIFRFDIINYILDEGAFEPIRGHELDAGLDLRIKEKIILPPNDSIIIDSGVHFEIPKGWFGKLESKSGLNIKHKIFCGGGVIDSGYTGSIIVRLYNASNEEYVFNVGDKFVQIVFMPIATPKLILVNNFGLYDRGNNGFGSTGR